jgi:hypothetical protein
MDIQIRLSIYLNFLVVQMLSIQYLFQKVNTVLLLKNYLSSL